MKTKMAEYKGIFRSNSKKDWKLRWKNMGEFLIAILSENEIQDNQWINKYIIIFNNFFWAKLLTILR